MCLHLLLLPDFKHINFSIATSCSRNYISDHLVIKIYLAMNLPRHKEFDLAIEIGYTWIKSLVVLDY